MDTGLEWQNKHQRKQIWVEYFIFYYNTEMEATCIVNKTAFIRPALIIALRAITPGTALKALGVSAIHFMA